MLRSPLPSLPFRATMRRTGVSTAALLAGAFLLGASGDDATTGSAKSGRIVDAPANIRNFVPKEAPAETNSGATNVSQVLTNLGPDAIEWYQHVQSLADPYFEGRAPGTRGMERAAEYVEFHFDRAGLKPAFPAPPAQEDQTASAPEGQAVTGPWVSYRQPFTIAGQRVTIHHARAAIDGQPLTAARDYVVVGSSGSGDITAPVTFVGYAIEAGRDGYSSFDEATNLTGRIALMLRYEPLDDDGKSRWSPQRPTANSAILRKLNALKQRGVAGIIVVNPPGAAMAPGGLETTESSQWGGEFQFPIVQMGQNTAEQILAAGDPQRRDLMAWRKLADNGEVKSVPMNDAVQVTLAADVEHARTATANIGGVIPGAGSLTDQWVIVGAHYDHLGYGHFGAADGEAGRGKLHPGADDNASGTAGLMILARRLGEFYASAAAAADRRSILILAFSSEEAGLLGSRYYVNHPSVALDKVDIMINMDMIGRLRDGNVLVTGTGTAERLADLLRPRFETSSFTLAVSPGGPGPSDHASFFSAGVPVLMFNTGLHEQYHTAGDVASLVNPGGAIQVLDLMQQVILDRAQQPEKLKFVKNTQGGGGGPVAAGVSLGTMPDYGAELPTGMRVQSVREGSAAAEAGIQEGDILTKWNGQEIEGPRAIMQLLGAHKPGDVVTITLQRDGKELEVKATLKRGQRRRDTESR